MIKESYDFNFLAISKDDLKNGNGIRVVLWVAGCSNCCKGCQNQYSWDSKQGLLFNSESMVDLITALAPDYIRGITLSGGDPLHPDNRDGVGEVLTYIKRLYPNKDVWLYTGDTLEFRDGKALFVGTGEEFELTWLNLVDVVCDGKFDIDIRKNDLKNNSMPKWVGSSNQRVIDIRESLKKGNIVIYSDKEKVTDDRDFMSEFVAEMKGGIL